MYLYELFANNKTSILKGADIMFAKQQKEDVSLDNKEKENESWQQIENSGSVTSDKGKHVIHCLTVIGQIEGHGVLPSDAKTTKYEHVIPQLIAVEEDPKIEGMLIVLNTVGGDVEAGLALAELISGMTKPTVSLVLGGGHSIGVPLAVSAKCSFIVPSATMTVHPVRTNGLVLGVSQTLDYFERMQKRITDFVVKNSSVSTLALLLRLPTEKIILLVVSIPHRYPTTQQDWNFY